MLLEAIARGPSPVAQAPEAGRMRLVSRTVLHGRPMDFRELARRAIPERTRYVVFDLDNTFHLGRNMGELLGWELSAADGYGAERLATLEATRRKARFLVDWSTPSALVRYAVKSTRIWALPGLFYFVWGKLAHRSALGRRLRFRRFGTEPVRAVQGVPQTALLHQLAGKSVEEVRSHARRVWNRYASDLVVDADDVAWLRARCPGVRIIISSASPTPLLEVAREALGVDEVIGSTTALHEGALSAPFWLDRVLFGARLPKHLSPPSRVAINGSHAKIAALRERFPAMFDEGAFSVGITDTGYGEDHCWASHFSRVIDVNSTAPFSPVVPASSPIDEIHSASLLTRSERNAHAKGNTNFFDSRRKGVPNESARVLEGADLEALLRETLGRANALAEARAARVPAVLGKTSAVRADIQATLARVEQLVLRYNAAVGDAKSAVVTELRRTLGALERLVDLRARLERPLAEATYALATELERARQLLEDSPRGSLALNPA